MTLAPANPKRRHKKRCLATTLIAACALLAATTGTAHAAKTETCGVTAPAKPILTTDSTAITSTGAARCNVRWRAVADLEVEQDGWWETAFAGGMFVAPQADGAFHAATAHPTPFVWGILDPSPYCAYRWRVDVTYLDRFGNQIAEASSPVTHPTCSKSLRA